MTIPIPLSTTSTTAPTFPDPTPSLPPNAFDFVADTHALILRVFNDELDIKDIAQEANRIRLKIQLARQAVAGLPDVERGMEEQMEEIRELEERIRRQRGVLKEVGGLGAVKGTARNGASKAGNHEESEEKMDVDV